MDPRLLATPPRHNRQQLGLFENAERFAVESVQATTYNIGGVTIIRRSPSPEGIQSHQSRNPSNDANPQFPDPCPTKSTEVLSLGYWVLSPFLRLLRTFAGSRLFAAPPSSAPTSPVLSSSSTQIVEAPEPARRPSEDSLHDDNVFLTQFGEFQGYDNVAISRLSTPQVYVASMLSSGRGLACWKPESRGFILGRQKVIAGDVGIFTPEGGFKAIFNIWDHQESIQQTGSTISDGLQYQTPPRCVRIHPYELREGDVVAQGMGASITRDADKTVSSFKFRYLQPFQVGAVLAMTSAAELEELDENVTLRDHIISHAELLYRHTNSLLRIQAHETLYIITGCIRSENWALAAFRHPMLPPDDTLTLVKLLCDNSAQYSASDLEYAWADIGSADARRGGDTHGRPVKDQSIFLRGFKLDISPSLRARVDPDPTAHPSARDQTFNKPGPGFYHPSNGGGNNSSGTGHQDQGSRYSGFGGSGSGRGHTGMSQPPGIGRRAIDRGAVVTNAQGHTITLSLPPSCHPCDLLNRWLLHKTGADFALCHDEDWMSTLKECSELPDGAAQEILQQSLGDGEEVPETDLFIIRKGVAILLPRICPPSPTPLDGNSPGDASRHGSSQAPPQNGQGFDATPKQPSSPSVPPQDEGAVRPAESSQITPNPRSVVTRFLPSVGHYVSVLKKPVEPGNPIPEDLRNQRNLSSTRHPGKPSAKGPTTVPEPQFPLSPVFGSDALKPTSGILILLMGQTGAGKSHFINSAAGADKASVRHALSTSDLTVRSYTVHNPHMKDPGNVRSKVVLVDTPGLNNAKYSDTEIIKSIAAWLNDNCNDDDLVGGIIFLHDIAEDRATVYADKHAWPVKYFDSPALLQHVFLTTGKWDLGFVQSNKKRYDDREKDLKEMMAWRRLLNRGATSCQYEGDYESAWKVIGKVLEMDALRAQLLRKEFNTIQGRLPGLQRPEPGIWRNFRNLLSKSPN